MIYRPVVLGFTKCEIASGMKVRAKQRPFDACGYFQGAHAGFTNIVLGPTGGG
jgi:hypothetical protein